MAIPLKSHWYYILLSMAAGPRHGLAIAREVRDLSRERVRLWPATLYGSLDELTSAGFIEEIGAAARRPDASERKRYYALTRAGQAALDAETQRLADLVKVARQLSRRHV